MGAAAARQHGCQGESWEEFALRDARDYALSRQQFDRSIAQFQSIQHMLADMATDWTAARALMIQTARATYCGSKELVRRKVGVVYNLRGQPRSFEDLTRVGGWQVAFGPQDCA